MNRIFLLLFLAIVIIAAIPRSVELLSGNYIFGYDQGRDYLAVKNIVVDKKLSLIGSEIGAGAAGFSGIFQGPFHYYFLATPFLISEGNPYSGIVLTFLYGMFTVALGYFLGKKMFGRLGGFLVAMLIAISPPLISFSRFVWNPHAAPVFILLAFYCIYMLCRQEKKDGKYFFGAAFFSAFIYNFQIAVAIPMVITLLFFSIIVLRIRDIRKYLFLFLGLFLAFSPMILFDLRHDFIGLRGFFDYFFAHGKTGIALFAQSFFMDYVRSFTFTIYDTFPRQHILSGELIGLMLGGLLLYFLIREKRRDLKYIILFFLCLIFINFFALSFLRSNIYQYYLVHLVLVYILFFSYICISAHREKKRLIQVILALFLIFVLSQHIPNMITTFRYDYFDYGGNAKIKGKIDALDYIYADAKGEQFCLLVFTPPVYTYAYDYAIWWYGDKKYHYTPCKEKKGIFYLWIEVDPQKPWSYKGWLETVVKTGEVIKTVELPSGFIIEKRVAEK